MNNNEIKKLLLERFPDYVSKEILLEDLITRISNLPEKYKTPLLGWLNGGEMPFFSCSGYSVKYLVEHGNFSIPSAVLTIAGIEYEPETVLRILEHIGLPPENRK